MTCNNGAFLRLTAYTPHCRTEEVQDTESTLRDERRKRTRQISANIEAEEADAGCSALHAVHKKFKLNVEKT